MEIQRNELVKLEFGSLANGEVFEYMGLLYMKTYPANGAIRYAVDLSDGEIISTLSRETLVIPFKCKLVEEQK